ncbi:Hsp20/alpha crystallin family protein [Nitrosococcus wardiae]|uniref:Hsp20/alpha crystallin family protein n=1 Tax=Nitrosococcus wardiae TaxID=1814290 RepID=A0A4V1AWB9_9GAMM|nr:Hsp20/alpha crystallin family protein [Nitrosococcus wardiae]QBQ56095.1 Hsp20/alpha crystallin family protein [Nitrosococcus wardiae]
MAETKEVGREGAKAAQEVKEMERAIRPAVDIFEDATGITLRADMPGVSRKRLQVRIDSDTLSIEGRVDIPVPEGTQPLYADVRSTCYQRSFSLSRELDGDNAEATLKEGVLTLRIRKREEHKPRKIQVHTE